MARRSHDKKPLYRKVNRCTHGVWRNGGGEHRWHRNTKAEGSEIADEVKGRGMRQSAQAGLDYTPLFRFLLSKVGEDFDDVYSEAVSRLPDGGRWNRDAPIFWMVARNEDERQETVRIGESTLFSGLYVDANNRLAVVNPDLTVEDIYPDCPCCTHTFNGTVVRNPYRGTRRPASQPGQPTS